MFIKMYDSPVIFCFLILVLNVGLFAGVIEASVHEYKEEKFVSKGNAFVVHGGSEGIYSSISDSTVNESSVAANNGDSYIR